MVSRYGLRDDQLEKIDTLLPGRAGTRWGSAMQARSADTEYLATPPLRDTRQRASHASDVFRSTGGVQGLP